MSSARSQASPRAVACNHGGSGGSGWASDGARTSISSLYLTAESYELAMSDHVRRALLEISSTNWWAGLAILVVHWMGLGL